MNYTELKDLAIAYADRYDAETDTQIPQFFIMVEARVNRLLKTRKQSQRAYTPTVADQEYYALPADWAGMRDIQLNSDLPTTDHTTQSMDYLEPKQFDGKRDEPSTGYLYYTVIGDQLQIYPKQDAGATIEMVYFQKVPALTDTDTNNWMSDDHPDIYLSGLCAEISLFAKDYQAAEGWSGRMEQLVSELDTVDWQERWSGGPLQVRLG